MTDSLQAVNPLNAEQIPSLVRDAEGRGHDQAAEIAQLCEMVMRAAEQSPHTDGRAKGTGLMQAIGMDSASNPLLRAVDEEAVGMQGAREKK